MLHHSKLSASRQSLLHRIRFQLGAALLISALLPAFLRYIFTPDPGALMGLDNSLVGTVIAILAGYYAFRRVSNFPGVRTAFQIIPVFLISYGTVLAAFFFLRIEYSRLQFIGSYILCIMCFFAIFVHMRRQRNLRFGVVPFGAIDTLLQEGAVEFVLLDDVRRIPPFIDGIVADLRADIPPEWERLLSDCALNGMLVIHAKRMSESLNGRVELEHLSENDFGSLIPGIIYGKVKRMLDVIVALAVLPLLIPVFAVCGALIKIGSPGPVFFVQTRMGYRGKIFRMVKLRSMREETALSDPRSSAITRDNDERVTPIGRFLRRYRIDELPQVFNVLRGDMSWIGPRPEAIELSEWYESELPFYRYRHIVRPGITGWAQVRLGHVAEVDQVMEKLHYDFYYIKHFSFWLDALIVAGTVRTVFGGFGAR